MENYQFPSISDALLTLDVLRTTRISIFLEVACEFIKKTYRAQSCSVIHICIGADRIDCKLLAVWGALGYFHMAEHLIR
jgi:hypothetical protein